MRHARDLFILFGDSLTGVDHQKADITALNRRNRPDYTVAVSYTHLDVYKRQGPDALELFSTSDAGRFDGFFIGSRMLGMNGFELAKEVRYSALPDGKTIPLILLVSDEDRQNAPDSQELGINAFLRKPIRRSDLDTILVHLTKK